MDILILRGALRPRFLALPVGALCLAMFVVVAFSLAEAKPAPLSVSTPQWSEGIGFADLVAAVRPAVVNISTTQKPRRQMFSRADTDSTFRDVVNPSLRPDAKQFLREHSWSSTRLAPGL